MELESYALIKDEDIDEYFFYSEGPRGKIKKVIRFNRIEWLSVNTYNLAFGDWDEVACRLDDRSVSNNNDRQKVLITVAKAVSEFMKSQPNAILWIRGSTPSRVRLYQMAISAFWTLINQQYEIQGKKGDRWLQFEPGTSYAEFLFFRKIM